MKRCHLLIVSGFCLPAFVNQHLYYSLFSHHRRQMKRSETVATLAAIRGCSALDQGPCYLKLQMVR